MFESLFLQLLKPFKKFAAIYTCVNPEYFTGINASTVWLEASELSFFVSFVLIQQQIKNKILMTSCLWQSQWIYAGLLQSKSDKALT